MRFLFLVFGATRNRIERSLKLSKATGRKHKKEPLKQTANLLSAHECSVLLIQALFLKPVPERVE